MEKIKLKSGLEVELKELSLEDEAAIMDTVKHKVNADGNLETEMFNTAILKFLRLSLNGKGDNDKYIRSLSYTDKIELYNRFQNRFLAGEEKASSSK
tara:strand:- start:681 stop:971 length:291 start_codon:yes stop_codon:yes gene_type:complete